MAAASVLNYAEPHYNFDTIFHSTQQSQRSVPSVFDFIRDRMHETVPLRASLHIEFRTSSDLLR